MKAKELLFYHIVHIRNDVKVLFNKNKHGATVVIGNAVSKNYSTTIL